MANPSDADSGQDSLRRLSSQEATSFLAPNPSLSETARAASRHLFSTLRPFSPKSPLDQLLVDGFDAEQIWHQIDLQSQPLLSTLRRRLKQFVRNPEEISKLKVSVGKKAEEKEPEKWDEGSDGFDEELEDVDEDEEEEEEGVKKERKGREEGMEVDEEDEEDGESGDGESEEEDEEENAEAEADGDGEGGIEDKFLKIDELTKFLEKEEENFENDEADQKGDEDDDEEESDEDAGFGFGNTGREDEEAEDMEYARFFILVLPRENPKYYDLDLHVTKSL